MITRECLERLGCEVIAGSLAIDNRRITIAVKFGTEWVLSLYVRKGKYRPLYRVKVRGVHPTLIQPEWSNRVDALCDMALALLLKQEEVK